MTRLLARALLICSATSVAGCGGRDASHAAATAAQVQNVASQLNQPVPSTITGPNGQKIDVDALVGQLQQAAAALASPTPQP